MQNDMRHDMGDDLENGVQSGPELVSETLVEEVSIDGMCGVY